MSPTLSHESRVMFVELLAREKEDTRGWLRTEMDRLVDPLVNSMFNRLETKLINELEQKQKGDYRAQVVNSSFVDQSANLISHPSTSLLPSLIPTYFNQHNSKMNYSNSIPIDTSFNSQSSLLSLVPPLPVSVLNAQTILPNELTVQSKLTVQSELNVQSQIPKPIKHEIEPTNTNEPFRSDQSKKSLPASIVNEQSNQNLVNWIDEEEDDEEDCDCDDCVYGGIGVKEEEDEDSDSVKLIEDDQEVEELSSRPVKIQRLDTTQSNIASLAEVVRLFQTRQSSTDEVTQQPNQVMNNQIITVHLKCPLSENCDCPDTFPGDSQLNRHMLDVHSIGPSRCLVKDCGQAFNHSVILKQHRMQVHQHTTQWQCAKCAKYFKTYHRLNSHYNDYHVLGHFQCSFPFCTFTGEYRRKVYNHYKCQHKDQPDLVCQQSGCQYRTSNSTRFKAHERAHLGIRPYRCKWANCHYSSSYQDAALNHIRIQHLNTHAQSSNPIVAHSVDPKDYLEVVE